MDIRQSDLERLIRHVITTYGMTALLKALIKYTDNSTEHTMDLNTGFKAVLGDYENRYIKYPQNECEHHWVMDGHNTGDPICSKCFKYE